LAVAVGGKAVLAADGEDRVTCLHNLAAALVTRFHHSGSLPDLDRAIEARQLVANLSVDGSARADALADLTDSLFERFTQTHSSSDLSAGIQVSRAAIAAWPDKSHPGRFQANLGLGLYLSSEQSANPDDLDDAIVAMRLATGMAVDGSVSKALVLNWLGIALHRRYQRTGDPASLTEAVACGREAVSILQEPEHRPAFLSNLAGTLTDVFEVFGRLSDLEESIAQVREALNLASPGSADWASYQHTLGNALRRRYDRLVEIADLDESIVRSRAAVDALPSGHPSLASFESTLSARLRVRSERLGTPSDLDEAISIGRRAVGSIPLTHPGRAECLSTLFGALRARFEHAGSPADLDEAISVGRQAVDITPAGEAGLPRRLSNLATGLWIRFTRTGDDPDLEEALELGRQALQITPAGHPDRAGFLYAQGRMLRVRFDNRGLAQDAAAAIQSWREATRAQAAHTHSRVEAGVHWGRLAAAMGNWPEAVRGYAAAVDLVPLLAWRGAGRDSREHMLADWPTLACDAAASAIQAHQPQLGLRLLEQGRGVLWSDLLEIRADLAALHDVADDLATRLEACRAMLDNATLANGASPAIDQRVALAREWDGLVGQVRELTGFEDFLKPPRLDRLLLAAEAGPVVVVNVSQWRCDALIVRADRVEVTELPGLTAEAANDRTLAYLDGLHEVEDAIRLAHETRWRVEDAMHPLEAITAYTAAKQRLQDAMDRCEEMLLDVTGWLWDQIAAPVLDALGITGPPEPGEPWPRLWWCPTGLLSLLPLHAAGHHTPQGLRRHESVLDRVVPSYTPTLRALLEARSNSSLATDTTARLLVVALTATPGQLPLPDVARESQLLTRLFGDSRTVLDGPAATWATVREQLPRHGWVHFSCHGDQDLTDPSRGGILLHDRLLTIAEISEGQYHGDFAFLSACKTATGGVALPDEAITLAAALHYTGYQHVIGTLWSVLDATAATVAEAVYTDLTSVGIFEPRRAAPALHSAIQRLRDAGKPLSQWTPFTHTGP